MNRDEMKQEAVKRMEAMGIWKPIVSRFSRNGTVAVSEEPVGAYFWASDGQKKLIADWEENTGSMVYTGVRTATPYGVMTSWLYVSRFTEDWEMDWEDIADGSAVAYVYNETAPELSEAGSIGCTLGPAGGLLRTW